MNDIQDLQRALKLDFKKPALLQQAFVHSSFTNETAGYPLSDNERLEFLGDAILNFVAAELIFHMFPDYNEGKLTEIRIVLIREETLAEIAGGLNLGDYLLMGKGEEASGGKSKKSNLSNTLEALIGAIYLDQGIEVTQNFLNERLQPFIDRLVSAKSAKNFKGILQEYSQSMFKKLPDYRLTQITGPDHDKIFTIEVIINGSLVGSGTGKNKKAAEMEAARNACKNLAII
jgi:ribonuclease-3